jgi:hypothetical protein
VYEISVKREPPALPPIAGFIFTLLPACRKRPRGYDSADKRDELPSPHERMHVKTHLHHIFQKLGVQGRSELRIALLSKWRASGRERSVVLNGVKSQ